MKHFYSLIFALFILNLSFGQTVIFQETFENYNNGTTYTTSQPEYSDGGGDFFGRTDLDGSAFDSNDLTVGSYYSLSNTEGNFCFAAMDIDAANETGSGGSSSQTLNIDNLNVDGFSNLSFVILLAEDDDGGNQDWDASDGLTIEVQLDEGGFNPILAVKSVSSSNGEPAIDTDFDGVGDGTSITSSFQEFTAAIPQGSILDIKISFNFNSGDEDIAIDNLRVVDGYSASPAINLGNDISGLNYILGNGPSNEGNFSVSGTDLIDDVTVTPPTNFEISLSTGSSFTSSPIVLPQTNGELSSTTVHTRLKSGLDIGSYSGDIIVSSQGVENGSVNLSGEVFDIPSQDLFISEYAEGSSNNKYVEIYNPLSTSVNLADYSLKGSNNGGGWIPARDFQLSGELNPGETLVVCTNQADPIILALTSTDFHLAYESPVHHNGNDAVGLFNGTTLIDIVGNPDNDPGSGGWEVAGTAGATKDNTLVRKNTVTMGNISWTESSGTSASDSEWVVLDNNTWTYAGSHPHSQLSVDEKPYTFYNLFPNPTNSGFVTIKSNQMGVVQAQVFDLLGKEVINIIVQNERMDVSNLNAGVYIVKLTQNNSSSSKKLIIQ